MSLYLPNNSINRLNSSLSLKGSLFTITTIELTNENLSTFADQLNNKIQQAPDFFKHAPIVIDLKFLKNTKQTINFIQLRDILSSVNLILVGIKNANSEQQKLAINAGFAILRNTTPNINETNINDLNIKNKIGKTLFIDKPVRSGQQIFAPDGDLIVLNKVSPGAELLAHGNIHVYGPLRGKALAGIHNNQEARIFCTHLEAELISIAGCYRISDSLTTDIWQQAVVISIKEDSLHISKL